MISWFPNASHRLHVFPRSVLITCFPPRLTPVACFLALSNDYLFSRVWHRLHVFPALSDDCSQLQCLGCRWLYILPHLRPVQVLCFHAFLNALLSWPVFSHLQPATCFRFLIQRRKTNRFYTCLSSRKTILLSTSWHCKRMKQQLKNSIFNWKTSGKLLSLKWCKMKYLCFSCFSVHFFDNVL